MKKLIAAALSAVMTFSGIAAGAAEFPMFPDENEILVNYNGEYMYYDGIQPKNVDGRVMLPFREALEGMGATVSYNDTTRVVTAQKGETTITFTLLDDTIYIDNNGEKSEITMDIPMIVEGENTLVPIRFMSSALGMEVGWSEGWFCGGTVLILDSEQFAADFREYAPNITKLMELSRPVYNSDHAEFSLNFTGTEENEAGEPETVFDILADAGIDMVVGENATELKGNVNFSLSDDEESISIEDGTFDIIVSGEVIYIKTDIIQKIAKAGGLQQLAAIAAAISWDNWFKVDLNSLFDEMSMPDEISERLMDALQGRGNRQLTADEFISMQLFDDGELSEFELYSINSMIEKFSMIDKYINVTETSDSGYTVSILIDNNAIVDMIRQSYGEYDDDEIDEIIDELIEEINDALDMEIAVNTQVDSEMLESNGKIVFNVNTGDAKIAFDLQFTETDEMLDEVTEPEIPESSIDLMEILPLLKLPTSV